MKEIYADYASTTPLDKEVERAMAPYWRNSFGNPNSLHKEGQRASRVVLHARRAIADIIGAHFKEIVFTGSATEANNLALRGAVRAWRRTRKTAPKIIISEIEHGSVRETAKDLIREDVEVIHIPVSRTGIIAVDKLPRLIDDRTALISIMHANNEIGTIQPLKEIARIVHHARTKEGTERIHPLFHTDAAQSPQYLNCNVQHLGVDLMTLSAHKLYGPKGIGALFVRNKKAGIMNKERNRKNPMISNPELVICPQSTGGGQEFGLRAGTENVPLIVGFAVALERAAEMRDRESIRIQKLRDRLTGALRTNIQGCAINGSVENRLPNNVNVHMPGMRASDMLVKLDRADIYASAGSACTARLPKPSYVIQAMGFSEKRSEESIRFTLGRETKENDVDIIVKTLMSFINTSQNK